MPARKPPKPDDKPQFDRFIEAAKRAGADETDAALIATIQKIAPHPKDDVKKRPKTP